VEYERLNWIPELEWWDEVQGQDRATRAPLKEKDRNGANSWGSHKSLRRKGSWEQSIGGWNATDCPAQRTREGVEQKGGFREEKRIDRDCPWNSG